MIRTLCQNTPIIGVINRPIQERKNEHQITHFFQENSAYPILPLARRILDKNPCRPVREEGFSACSKTVPSLHAGELRRRQTWSSRESPRVRCRRRRRP